MKKYMSGFVALCLVLALVVSMLPAAAAIEFDDVSKKHWAYNYIQYLSEKGVLSGDGNGKFRPNDTVTRAEFIRMMVSTFGLTEEEEIEYTKVPQWAIPYVRCAAAQGFLLNYKKDADFGAKLSRQEAVALLMRYLGFTADEDFDTSKIKDFKSVAEIYRPYVKAAVQYGIVTGYEDGSFRPSRTLSRAEALTILYQSAGGIYNTTTNVKEVGASDKNATINASISLTSLHLTGNVFITEGAHFVTLNDCDIDGTLYIRGTSQVNFSHTTAERVIVDGPEAIVSLGNNAQIDRLDSYGQTTLNINHGSLVDITMFHSGAENSVIRGEGTVQRFGVACKNVTTLIEPDEYYIAAGMTAQIGGVAYPAGSGVFKNSGLSNVTATASEGKIVVHAEAAVDGTVYAAMWMNHKTALTLVEIIEQAAQTVKVKTGDMVTISLNCIYDPKYYSIGLLVMPDGENAAALSPLYNQGVIGAEPVAVGTRTPEPVKAAAPQATVELGDGIVAVKFDQPLYYQDNGKLTELSASSEVITSVTAQSGVVNTAVPNSTYRLEILTENGKTSFYLYFYEGIPAETRYIMTISDRLFSIYGIAPEKIIYSSPVSEEATSIQPTFSPKTRHISRDGILTIEIPEAATAMRYTYSINGASEPSLNMTVQGNAELSFDSLPANTLVHVTAVTLTASGKEIGEKIEADYVVNVAPIVVIGGVSYTDLEKTIPYVEPVSVSALPPNSLTGSYRVRLSVSGREIYEPMIVELAGTQIHAELIFLGEVIGETNITLE